MANALSNAGGKKSKTGNMARDVFDAARDNGFVAPVHPYKVTIPGGKKGETKDFKTKTV